MPVVTVTPDPLTHVDPACVQTDGTLEKVLDLRLTHADGSITHEKLTLVEAKITWSVPAGVVKVIFHDTSGECNDVTRIVV